MSNNEPQENKIKTSDRYISYASVFSDAVVIKYMDRLRPEYREFKMYQLPKILINRHLSLRVSFKNDWWEIQAAEGRYHFFSEYMLDDEKDKLNEFNTGWRFYNNHYEEWETLSKIEATAPTHYQRGEGDTGGSISTNVWDKNLNFKL